VGSVPSAHADEACGLSDPAFCDTFDTPQNGGTRSGDLNPVVWGVSRTTGNVDMGQNSLNGWFPTTLQACDGDRANVMSPNDVIICNGQVREAVNDGHTVATLAMYPKQPFDFAGRSGKVTFDVSNDTLGSHDAWPEFWLTDKPVPAPFSHLDTWKAVPQDGFGLRFAGFVDGNGKPNTCPEGNDFVGVDRAVIVRNYTEQDTDLGGDVQLRGFDCVRKATGLGQMNHYELDISQNQIDVYATDAGTSSPLKHIAAITNANLSITRGLIWLEDSHYNAAKAIENNGVESGPHTQHTFAWDTVGFDGPFTYRDLSFDALDALTPGGGGSVSLGKKSDPGQTAVWKVEGMPANPTADAVRVLFNFTDNTNPSVINIIVNGQAHAMPWPYPDNGASSWRTLSYVVPISDLVVGENTVQIGGDQTMITSNVNIVLVNGGSGDEQTEPTPKPAPTS
jgi:hypothetical protein